jgi:hypothetical protein
MTLEELERDAYQRGDVETAEILALAMDAEEQERQHDDTVYELERRIEALEREHSAQLGDIRAAVWTLREALEAAQRMGNREAIMEALAGLEEYVR